MPPVQLYGMWGSSPCRLVALTLEATNTPYEFIEVDLSKDAHKTPEYLKLNPQHNIPTFKDADGFMMNESRAIASYIATKYDKSGKLYPTDAKVRARVDQRLSFDMGTFWLAFREIISPYVFGGEKPTKVKYDRLREVLGWANDFVQDTGYVAGTEYYTLADLAFLVSYSSMLQTTVVDFSVYPELNAWYEKMRKEVPNHKKINEEGATLFGEWLLPKLKSS